jgi:uncharacterized protein YndB with AHSA1/START domain
LAPGIAVLSVCAAALLSTHASPASAASLTRRIDVAAPPDAVWSAIGPFCSIASWHPAIGSCTEDGKMPPTRTLITRDGKTTFVEPEIARSDSDHFYAYSFASSPFPVSHYEATIRVRANGDGGSTVVWHGTYTPDWGREKEAREDFAAVYEAGLAAIQAKFAR